MKSSWRSPDGGSSVTPNTKIEPSEAAFCAWWSTASTPIRSFHTVSEGEFCEVELPIYGVLRSSPYARSPKFAKKVATTSLFGGCGAYRGTCRMVSVIERGGADRPTSRKGEPS